MVEVSKEKSDSTRRRPIDWRGLWLEGQESRVKHKT